MTQHILFPYARLTDDEAILTVSQLRIDGKARADWLRRDERTVSLFEHTAAWGQAELDVEVSCPTATVESFEKAHGPVAAVVVAHCLPTNSREQVRLTRGGTDAGRWTGTLPLDRDTYRGRVALQATLTATVGGVPYRPVASANGWSVHFDEPESFRLGKSLPVKWHDFTRPDAPLIARSFPESTHAVEFSGSLPTLFLNSHFVGLEALLMDRKDRKGAEKALHDFLRTGIARSVWLTLLRDALADIPKPDVDTVVGARWPDTPWRAEVLKKVLLEIDPSKSDAELLGMAVNEWQEAGAAGDLFARAEAVIGELVTSNEVVRRFVQKLPEEVIG